MPEDLSLVITHNAPAFEATGTAFDTVAIPEVELGRSAVAMLLRKISQPNEALPSIECAMTHTTGRTCARAAVSVALSHPC